DPHTMYVNREANGTVADNRLVRWDTTSGRDLQQSAATEDDSGNVTGWTSVSVSGKVRANQVEIQETGAGGTNQQLWEVVNTTGGVFTIRTRTNADGGGNDALQLERNGTLVSRCQAVTQYGLTEIADSYLVEVDTASSPAATSVYKSVSGASLNLASGFSYEFEVSVWTHDGTKYDHLTYYVSALRTAGGSSQLVKVSGPDEEEAEGLDMQFHVASNQLRCQPTVTSGEGGVAHRNVQWAARLLRRRAAVTAK